MLTIDEIDPYGKIPEFKFCAVQIEPLGGGDRHPQVLQDLRQPPVLPGV